MSLARSVLSACVIGTLASAALYAQTTGFTSAPPLQTESIYTPAVTEHPRVLWTELPVNIWRDQQRIWSSPFHMNRTDAVWWIAFAAATAGLMESDRTTARDLPNTPQQIRLGTDFSRIGASYSLSSFAAGFYGIGLLTDDAHARETGIAAGEALIDSLVAVEVLKLGVGRERPNAGPEAGSFFDGGASFPSGHAISSWALASVVAHEYRSKKVALLAYGLASVVSSARFAAREHFLSDLVAGGGMGWFIGRLVYNEHSPEGHRFQFKNQLRPIFDPGTRTYGIGVLLEPTRWRPPTASPFCLKRW